MLLKFRCDYGSLEEAFDYYQTNGIVTGSEYDLHLGCWPYPFKCAPDGVNYPTCQRVDYETPKCKNQCQGNYPVPFNKDKHFGKEPRLIVGREAAIRREIYNNGPVAASFTTYSDFKGKLK